MDKRGSFKCVVEIHIKGAASRGSFHCFLVKTFGNKLNEEKIRGQRGKLGALAGIREFHLFIFLRHPLNGSRFPEWTSLETDFCLHDV